MHNACMPAITIRNVPESTRDELASRARASGRSLQEYLLARLGELASEPDLEALLNEVAATKARFGTRLDAAAILRFRDEGRNE